MIKKKSVYCIVVTYNAMRWIDECLNSLAISSLKPQIIVVDNGSNDNSVSLLKDNVPNLIINSQNAGFGKACNQGFKLSSGQYILFLNPDTIVPEDCFEKCISFLLSHTNAGALGVKMLDGDGKFLDESKRAFPSLSTSLFKMSGLASLFPHSKIFAKYYLGHLDENKNHEVDVLAGAFMLIKRNVLELTGGFDEAFFMYGEDIDLSYRIQKTGFKNYYFSETQITHFKGESTKKGSLNYIKMFYGAMSIFVNKHYKNAGLFKFVIHIGIWFAASIAAMGNFFRNKK